MKNVLIYGPPNSGKTTYALDRMKEGDLIIDMDRLQSSLTNLPPYTLSDPGFEISGILKNAAIQFLASGQGSYGTAYVIGGYPKRQTRQAIKRKLNAEVVFIDTDLQTCLSRPVKNSHYPDCIHQWFENYEPDAYRDYIDAKAQRFYDSTEWKRVRKEVLALDHHECVECARHGTYTPAKIVHHVHHLKDHWDLRSSIYDENGERNLVSLCADCHAKAHPERGGDHVHENNPEILTEEWW